MVGPVATVVAFQTTSGKDVQLPADAKTMYDITTAKPRAVVEAVTTEISDEAIKATQLQALQDNLDTAMASAKRLANDGHFYDLSTSLYKQITTTVTSSDASLTPSDFLKVTYANGAPKTPLNITVHEVAKYATVTAGRPASIQSEVGFTDTNTQTLTNAGITTGTLKLRKADFSGFESITLVAGDPSPPGQTLQQAVDAINAVNATTKITATAELVAGSYYLKLTADEREVSVDFGDGDLSTFNWDRNIKDAAATYTDLDTTAISTNGIADNDILDITGTGNAQVTLLAADTLQEVISKINTVAITTGVTATSLYDETSDTYRLTLGTATKGTTITLASDTAEKLNAVKSLGLSGTEGTYTGDATINGVNFTTTDNKIDLKQGRVIELKGANSAKQFSVSVDSDTSGVTNEITELLTSLNIVALEVQWHEGVRDKPGEDTAPLLAGSKPLDLIKDFLRNIAGFVAKHSDASYRQVSSIGISLAEDASHNSVDLFKVDPTVLSAALSADYDKVATFFKNYQAFVVGNDEANYTLVNGPTRSLPALRNQAITIDIRYQNSKYYADFTTAGVVATTKTVEIDPDQQYITAPTDTAYTGMMFKRTSASWTPIQTTAEKVIVKYNQGWMGNIYEELQQLEGKDPLRPDGRLHVIQKARKSDTAALETKKQSKTDALERTEERSLKKLATYIAAQQRLAAMKERMALLMSLSKGL